MKQIPRESAQERALDKTSLSSLSLSQKSKYLNGYPQQFSLPSLQIVVEFISLLKSLTSHFPKELKIPSNSQNAFWKVWYSDFWLFQRSFLAWIWTIRKSRILYCQNLWCLQMIHNWASMTSSFPCFWEPLRFVYTEGQY